MLASVVATVVPHVQGFYIPGVAPKEYADGDVVDVKAVKMTSTRQFLPFEYYSLPFCRPEKLVYRKENLGEVLRGDRITNTPYAIRMNENVTCRLLCMDSAAGSKEIAYVKLHACASKPECAPSRSLVGCFAGRSRDGAPFPVLCMRTLKCAQYPPPSAPPNDDVIRYGAKQIKRFVQRIKQEYVLHRNSATEEETRRGRLWPRCVCGCMRATSLLGADALCVRCVPNVMSLDTVHTLSSTICRLRPRCWWTR